MRGRVGYEQPPRTVTIHQTFYIFGTRAQIRCESGFEIWNVDDNVATSRDKLLCSFGITRDYEPENFIHGRWWPDLRCRISKENSILFNTTRVRSTTGRYCFHRCVSVDTSRVVPSSSRWRGYHSLPDGGYRIFPDESTTILPGWGGTHSS